MKKEFWIFALGVGFSFLLFFSMINAQNKGSPLESLSKPKIKGVMSVEEAIAKRRSVRSFEKENLSPEAISQLLFAAQGITDAQRGLRAAPSAGATYPLETYLVTQEGVFRYIPQKHGLETVKKDDVRKDLARAAWNQSCVEQAPAIFVFAAISERTTGRYGERGHRYIHMEAGHAAQNIHLQAIALGLGSVAVGAFEDEEVRSVIGATEKEEVLYMIPVGKERE